jgi:enoyl reductase-like protein
VLGVSLRHPLRRHAASNATWAAAVERYRRAVDRYYSSLALIPGRVLRQRLTELGGPLEAVLEDFEDAMARRSRFDRGREADVLASIHRAATLCAHATEAALMANDAAWRHADEDAARGVDTVRQLVKAIDELGDRARPAP